MGDLQRSAIWEGLQRTAASRYKSEYCHLHAGPAQQQVEQVVCVPHNRHVSFRSGKDREFPGEELAACHWMQVLCGIFQ